MKLISIIIIFYLIAVLARSVSSDPEVEIEPKFRKPVKLGDPLVVLCRVGVKIHSCRITVPGEPKSFIFRGTEKTDESGIGYHGGGLEAGQCGVSIERIEERHDGVFQCSMAPENGRAEISAETTIIVASKSVIWILIMFYFAQLARF